MYIDTVIDFLDIIHHPEIRTNSIDWAQLSKLFIWGWRQSPVSETPFEIKPRQWICPKYQSLQKTVFWRWYFSNKIWSKFVVATVTQKKIGMHYNIKGVLLSLCIIKNTPWWCMQEWRYSSIFLTLALRGLSGQLHPQVKSPWYPLDRRLSGALHWSRHSGKEKKFWPLLEIKPCLSIPQLSHCAHWAILHSYCHKVYEILTKPRMFDNDSGCDKSDNTWTKFHIYWNCKNVKIRTGKKNKSKQNVKPSIQKDTRKLWTNMKFKRHMKGRHKKVRAISCSSISFSLSLYHSFVCLCDAVTSHTIVPQNTVVTTIHE
jgi:hypothetical protein